VPVVTALEPDPRGTGGVVVFLDGASFALVASSDAPALGLAPGAELSPAQVQRVEQRAELFAARAAALRILAYRALPSTEIRRRLVRKGYAKSAADEAVAALVGSGLIRDGEFARHFASTRARRFRYGPARLARDLRRLGIEPDEAARAVREAFADEGVEPVELLREAAARKLATLADLDLATRRRRLKTYLLRRGFAAADVIEVVKAALAAS
jgi:regulatory protein